MLGNPDRRSTLRAGIITSSVVVVLLSTLSAFASLARVGESVGDQSAFEASQSVMKTREILKAETDKAIQDARAEAGVSGQLNELILTEWDTRRRDFWTEMKRWQRTPTFQQYAANGELTLLDPFRRKLGTYDATTGLVCNTKGECR